MFCPHCQAPSSALQLGPEDAKAITGRSTETEAQEHRILAALRSGPKTTDQLRKLGCYQVSARVWSLRHKKGYEIDTELFNGFAADGYSHARMARYTLVSEPLPLGGKEDACN